MIFKTGNGIIQTGNGIIQTGNGIVSPTCRPLIKKLLWQDVSHFPKEFKIDIQNRKWIYLNRKWNHFSHFQADDQKTTFTNIFLISTKELKIDFQNRKWNYPNRKWNYFSHFQASDQKTSLTTSYPC